MRNGRDGGKTGKKQGKKTGKKEKTDENSGHYVIASSQPPKQRPVERRTLVPKNVGTKKTIGRISRITFAIDRFFIVDPLCLIVC